jgi:predicted RNA binding protein YcfA (HicA-like mRNA interferase family)
MSFPKQIWDQLKNLTCDDIVRALEKDGWVLDITRGARRVYRHPSGRRVAIDYHPQKTYGPGLLRALLEDIGWTVEDLRRLKLIKK